MTEYRVGTRGEWQAAREELLERENELANLSKEIAQQRRELPRVPVEKEYILVGTDLPSGLAEGPGWSAFALSDGVVHHTYSRYAPDGDLLAPYYYQLLDQVPKGRGDEMRVRRHDEYEEAGSGATR